MVFRTDSASVFQHVLAQDRSMRKSGDFRHWHNQQRGQDTRHFLADFRGEPIHSFLVCLLMRTRRGVSLVQASPANASASVRSGGGGGAIVAGVAGGRSVMDASRLESER
jgi:hypothetical protein